MVRLAATGNPLMICASLDALPTPLLDFHRARGARLVEFAGYLLPVQYPTGILAEHRHTRTQAGLFDVSHMGQCLIVGADAGAALEALLPANCVDQPLYRQLYSFLTNAEGGIEDDLMVLRLPAGYHLVVNASRKAGDFAHLARHLGERLSPLPGHALLALQGPAAAAVLARHAPTVAGLGFMTAAEIEVAGCPCLAVRSGYTGEDGFEISLPAAGALAVAEALAAHPEVLPIGLGARDSLRLEAGLCLYGHELTPTTTPASAGVAWAIPSPRRHGGARPGGFPGAARILAEISAGPAEVRVGLLPEGPQPVRDGTPLLDGAGVQVGRITSGGFGPTLGRPVAMGYVAKACAVPGTRLLASLRGREVALLVADLPLVAHRYRRAGSSEPI
jgi:aminomethyltransferase